jgi:CRP-like cAMP-binding protein
VPRQGYTVVSDEKHLHIKIKPEVYRKLKSTCADESRSIQAFVADLISNSMVGHPESKNFSGKSKDKKLNIFNVLQECLLINSASELELMSLADTASLHHFDRGEPILGEEDSPDSIYIIINGIVKIYKLASSGRKFAIDILSESDVFGIVSLLSGFTYTSGAQAMENTDLVAIPREAFLDFTFHNRKIVTQINCLVSTRIARLNVKLLDLITCTAEHRLAKVLDELSTKYGNNLHLTHNDIAEMSGTTNETATRIMTRLKNRGIISISRGTVKIMDKKNLLS